MTTNPYKNGLILFVCTMVLFFLVYYFFADANYFLTTVKVNAFILPFLYTVGAFLAIWKIRKLRVLSFGAAFKQSFVSLFIGGFLSMLTIFSFLNYMDIGARDLLNYQFVTTQVTNMDNAFNDKKNKPEEFKTPQEYKEFQQNYLRSRAGMEYALKTHKNYFSLKWMSGIFGVIVLFYLFLSVILGGFLKTKKRFE